ncbi:hypothetical protein BJ878DRAFT_572107 [Calycina marina]|uniref:Uncharacterized protein n=1 Tax=Calycina marina TaxID=1763456 RepID=A0A9P7ZAP8_9HELO|nr:hypothetical protein BJ878DRAFT_572107 [Calycina marina]
MEVWHVTGVTNFHEPKVKTKTIISSSRLNANILDSFHPSNITKNRRTSLLSLPSEFRNKIYSLSMLYEAPMRLDSGPYREEKLTPALFNINNTVHLEVTFMFYAGNCFECSTASYETLAAFIGSNGSNNASYIRHIIIAFPELCRPQPGSITIDENSSAMLTATQSAFVNLETFTTFLFSTNAMIFDLEYDFPDVSVDGTLAVFYSSFRVISSLQKFAVETYNDSLSAQTVEMTESRGWIANATGETENDLEWAETRSFQGCYGEYSPDDEDDYDIDDDSGFWIRAAD